MAPATSLQLHKHRHASALVTTPLKGDNADDYTTPVYLDGQGPFALNVDTGSALVGVAGNETIGCDLYYDSSACDGGPIKVVYGSGFWSGVVCEATVTLGAYNVTGYKFGARRGVAMATSTAFGRHRRGSHAGLPEAESDDDLRAHARGRRDVAAPHDPAAQLHAGHRGAHGRRGRAHRGLAAIARSFICDARGRGPRVRPPVLCCVEINKCVGCTRQFFTKSFLGDDAAILARSSGEEPASPRHRAGIASMAWRTT